MEAARLSLVLVCCLLAATAAGRQINTGRQRPDRRLNSLQRPDRRLNSLSGSYASTRTQNEYVCQSGTYPPSDDHAVPNYVINLDLPPEYRYTKVMEDMEQGVVKLVGIVRNMIKDLLGESMTLALERVIDLIGEKLPYPFSAEIRGIAEATSLNEGDVALMNIFYEIFTVCTSIVAETENGTLYHGRNLDFGLFLGWDKKNHTWLVSEALRPLTATFDYRRNNRTVFRSAGFAGMVGVLTGVRPGLFSLTIDERFTAKPGLWYMLKWLLGAELAWNTVITRQVLENGTDYDSVQKTLAKEALIAPVYFILGGNTSSQGCVITRDQYKADIWSLGTASLSQKSTWYLLQTNYDHWKAPPFYDDRRGPGIACMDSKGQAGFGLHQLYDVLHSKPNRNRLTVYTALMQVNQGHLEAWLQDCPDQDCPIW